MNFKQIIEKSVLSFFDISSEMYFYDKSKVLTGLPALFVLDADCEQK